MAVMSYNQFVCLAASMWCVGHSGSACILQECKSHVSMSAISA